jgi:zinc protease
MASAILNLERYDLGLDYYRHYPEMVRKVSVEEILASAHRYWNTENLAVGIAGP